MRTTVTLEPDAHARLEEYARHARTSFRAALNEVLRRGLVAGEASPNVAFRVVPHNAGAPHHTAARDWLEGTLSGTVPVARPWAVTIGFVRLMTHTRVVVPPMSPKGAVESVRAARASSNSYVHIGQRASGTRRSSASSAAWSG